MQYYTFIVRFAGVKFIILLGFLLFSCSGDSDPNITPTKETIEENEQPTTPELNNRIDGISPDGEVSILAGTNTGDASVIMKGLIHLKP